MLYIKLCKNNITIFVLGNKVGWEGLLSCRQLLYYIDLSINNGVPI